MMFYTQELLFSIQHNVNDFAVLFTVILATECYSPAAIILLIRVSEKSKTNSPL